MDVQQGPCANHFDHSLNLHVLHGSQLRTINSLSDYFTGLLQGSNQVWKETCGLKFKVLDTYFAIVSLREKIEL